MANELKDAVALGELGLDHGSRVDPASFARQRRAFQVQLDLAYARKIPMVFHILKAHDDALDELEARGAPQAAGLVHSFSGTLQQAERYVRLGLLISVGGPLARKGFGKLKETVVSLAGPSLVLETDSPDQPPPSHAGTEGPMGGLNEPVTLWEVARVAGELRGEAPAKILAQSRDNLLRVFPGISARIGIGKQSLGSS